MEVIDCQFFVDEQGPHSEPILEIIGRLMVERYPGVPQIEGRAFHLRGNSLVGYRLDEVREA